LFFVFNLSICNSLHPGKIYNFNDADKNDALSLRHRLSHPEQYLDKATGTLKRVHGQGETTLTEGPKKICTRKNLDDVLDSPFSVSVEVNYIGNFYEYII
jgi:hypothetical protein